VRTPERLKSLLGWFTGTVMQLREPHTKMVVVGTLKTAGADIYNFVLGNPLWNTRVVGAILSHALSDIEYEPVYDASGTVVDVRVLTEGVRTLWPERWGIRALLVDMLASIRSIWIREKLNDLRALAGSVFRRSWFRYVERDALPQVGRVVQAWDTAFESSRSADYSVCVTAGVFEGHVYVLDVFRQKVEFPALVAAIRAQYARWKPGVVLVERKASGRSAVQVLRKESTIPLVDAEPGARDKVSRARAITPYYEGGRVYHVAGAQWLAAFEDELTLFPEAAHDDQVDALVYAVLRLMLRGSGIYV